MDCLLVGCLIGSIAWCFAQYIPNGEAVPWNRRLRPGCWYRVRAIASPYCAKASIDNYATLQDGYGMYAPFFVFLPSQKDYPVQEGDILFPFKDGYKLMLLIAKSGQFQPL